MWPFHRKKAIDPGKPHAYQARTDPGIAAVSSGGPGHMRSNVSTIAATSAYLREDPACAVPGCGRARDHDLHAAAPD
jgi:hypothetical protein